MNSQENSYSRSSDGTFIPSFLSRLKRGDHHVGWALSYYKSWNKDFQPRYLFLAEEHIYSAVSEFAHLQSDTSPRINEYYIVRERRVRSCRFLAELQFSAVNRGLALRNSAPAMCVF